MGVQSSLANDFLPHLTVLALPRSGLLLIGIERFWSGGRVQGLVLGIEPGLAFRVFGLVGVVLVRIMFSRGLQNMFLIKAVGRSTWLKLSPP